MSQQVTCINMRGNHYDPHERINHIGGPGWRVSHRVGIDAVKADPRSYFVSTADGTVYLTIGHYEGSPYLTTESDGATQNNLLALPEC